MGTTKYVKNRGSYLGALLLLVGLAVVARKNKRIAGALSLLLVGIGSIAYGITKDFLRDMGLA